ncbi:MAG: helix-turn-helix domain-containing protein, partial [Pirellulaceae bacterium]
VFPIEVVPLRQRIDDLPELASRFVHQFSRKAGIKTPRLKQRHIIELQQYTWPGNVRELQNVIERAVILARSGSLEFQLPSKLPTADKADTAGNPTTDTLLTHEQVKDLERRNLMSALARSNWKISGAGGAAELLGVNAATLSSRLRAMGITRPT